jgi:hypothetical protein
MRGIYVLVSAKSSHVNMACGPKVGSAEVESCCRSRTVYTPAWISMLDPASRIACIVVRRADVAVFSSVETVEEGMRRLRIALACGVAPTESTRGRVGEAG